MQRVREIAEEATTEIDGLLRDKLSSEQWDHVENIIERTVIKALLEGQNRAVDATLQYPFAEQDIAHKVAAAIRKKNELLITNLSSMR